jgi:hypothetical protein
VVLTIAAVGAAVAGAVAAAAFVATTPLAAALVGVVKVFVAGVRRLRRRQTE